MRHATYNDNLREAIRFEDFVAHEMSLSGITFARFSSPEYQTLIGENSAGIEIKLDRQWKKYGRVFIETSERHNEFVEWKPSGPFKADNTWLMAVGDYEKFWIFGAKFLRRTYDRFVTAEKPRYRSLETSTARGFSIPLKEADDFAELVITPRTVPPDFSR